MTEPDDYTLSEPLHHVLRNLQNAPHWNTASDALVVQMSRDPAVLAALPEVQAMIAAAYEVAAKVVDTCNAEGPYQSIGAAGRIRALTPADATAALARTVQDAEARGMRRAAAIALRKRGEGDTPEAILARAAEIERDAK